MSDPVGFISREPRAVERIEQDEPSESNGSPFVTWALVGINVLLFIIPAFANPSWLWKPTGRQLLDWGAGFGPLTLHGQAWRLVTCCFLHLGVIHIAMNMFILLQVGVFAEAIFGKVRFLLLYLLAGIGGSLASAFRQPPVISVGASGAIFGVYGAVLAFLLIERRSVNPGAAGPIAKGAGIFLFYNLVFSLAIPNIDMSAHLGGLAAGFLVGLPLARPLTPGRQSSYPLRSAAVLGAALGIIAAILAGKARHTTPRDELQRQLLAGNSITVGWNDRVIYSGAATAEDAQKVADALKPMGFFHDKGAILFLSKGPEGARISIVTNDKDPSRPGDGAAPRPDPGPSRPPKAWDDPDFLTHARAVGAMAAPAVGGPPINVAILTQDGVVEKVLRIDTRIARIGHLDAVWYSGYATPQDAEALGKALTAAGFFRDAGGLALLSRQGGQMDVSMIVKEGSWNDPKVQATFQGLGRALSKAMGAPVRMHLADKGLTNQMDL
jgi:membrane associated rhomboid family serine protease